MDKLIELWNSKYKYAIIAAGFAVLLLLIWMGINAPAGSGNG